MMEVLAWPQGSKQNMQTHRKSSPSSFQKDLWLVVREGSLADVDLSLAMLKKGGGNINSRNNFGLTPLHIATWRNNIPVVRRLLAAGADPDARDGESGWSSLHRALHFGHLAVASVLLQSGASISLEDCKSRTPVDLLSGPVSQAIGDDRNSVATELYSWGSGANYQLGTGNAHMQKLPGRVDELHDHFIQLISAAKFHSVAVSALGEVYTWGFGRGGRLGHPDFDIHSGQAAVITPRQVTFGLGSRRVKTIAAAKHHTVLATEGGEVFTWGSNREGQLGYAVDTQPTPRRVTSLKSKIISVAAANKHTAVVSDSGEVFTWGCNREGQLGYGTSNSGSSYTPRLVEYLKGKVFTGVAAAKYHTIVLGADGEVFTWGHRLVTPRRVVISRNLKKSGSSSLKFHRMERLHVSSIAAGMVHSMALTDDGALFYWASADPDLRCQQLFSLGGKNVVSISAGKYWSAVATATGDIYMWDGKKGKDKPPALTRLSGVKKATSVSVGETHLLIVSSLYHPIYPENQAKIPEKQKCEDDIEEFDENFMFGDMDQSTNLSSTVVKSDSDKRLVPSLKFLCEKVAAESLVEPRNALQMLEIADSLGADNLKKHCEDITIRNLDYVLTVSSHAFTTAAPEILVYLEHLLDQRSSEPWSYRRLPTPTATFPVIINSEEEDSDREVIRTRDNHFNLSVLEAGKAQRSDSFFQTSEDPNEGICKQVRALRKKLQQIEMLEMKQSKGHHLDDQQVAKLQSRSVIENSLAELGTPVATRQINISAADSTDVKANKRAERSRKQRRKNKQKALQEETMSGISGIDEELNSLKDLPSITIPSVTSNKEEEAISERKNQVMEEVAFAVQKKDISELPKSKISSPVVSKKKNRKGGLSMFLSGALDDKPKEATPPPPTPKSEGPAWGGAKVSKGFASLREIQDEQSKTIGTQPAKSKELMEESFDGRNDGKVSLGSFLSKPIPVVSVRASQPHDTDKGTPSWASGTPPQLSLPSLRDIQVQQGKKQQSISSSPKTRTAGFSVTTGQGSPSDSPTVNRWYKPETGAPSSLRSIQIEEKAMKDLKRFYSSVKIVKNTT